MTGVDQFVMTVVRVDEDDAEVLLLSPADGETTVQMHLNYGAPCFVKDKVGEAYLVTIEKLSEAIEK